MYPEEEEEGASCCFNLKAGQQQSIANAGWLQVEKKQKIQSNSAKCGINDRCCQLVNHKLAIASSGWEFNRLMSPFTWAARDPDLTQCIIWPNKRTAPATLHLNLSNGLSWMHKCAIRQTDGRKTDRTMQKRVTIVRITCAAKKQFCLKVQINVTKSFLD